MKQIMYLINWADKIDFNFNNVVSEKDGNSFIELIQKHLKKYGNILNDEIYFGTNESNENIDLTEIVFTKISKEEGKILKKYGVANNHEIMYVYDILSRKKLD